MDDLLLMDRVQHGQQRPQQLIRFRPGQPLVLILFHISGQRFARDILHDDIDRIVLQERIEQAHYPWHGAQFQHRPTFTKRPRSALFEVLGKSRAQRLDVRCIVHADRRISGKILLDRHNMIQHQVTADIGHAESTAAKTSACQILVMQNIVVQHACTVAAVMIIMSAAGAHLLAAARQYFHACETVLLPAIHLHFVFPPAGKPLSQTCSFHCFSTLMIRCKAKRADSIVPSAPSESLSSSNG